MLTIEERYNWIVRYIRENEVPPTIKEMAAAWDMSQAGALLSRKKMEALGWLELLKDAKGRHIARGIVPKRQAMVADLSHLSMPKVSIIVVTYKRPVSLLRLLEHLRYQAHTNFDDIEVIVFNDGSPDGYRESYENDGFPVTYTVEERAADGTPRLYSLKNKAIGLAKHPLIWLLDDDLYFDEHTLFILRLHHMLLKESRPLIVPHYANNSEPFHYQNPFSFMPQPVDWTKTRAWPSFAGMSFWKSDWVNVGGIDERYDGAMGFADLDFGMEMFKSGCQIILADGITCFIDDNESQGSHRDRFLANHQNARRFVKKWPNDWQEYDPGLADVA